MIVAPAKTPQWIIDRLSGDLEPALSAPEIKDQIRNNGMLPVDSLSMPLRDFLNAEIARWGAVVRQAGIAGSQ
jgi:tripartite-type tricarboxylate transporter receptor subunit TctC